MNINSLEKIRKSTQKKIFDQRYNILYLNTVFLGLLHHKKKQAICKHNVSIVRKEKVPLKLSNNINL